jgi:hypothetical protein
MKFESCALFNILIFDIYSFLGLIWHRLLIEAHSLLIPTAGVLSTIIISITVRDLPHN